MTDNESLGIKKVIGNAVYEITPSEKGYAYVITLATCIVLVALFGYTNSLGMMFNDYLMDIGAGVGGLTFIYGMMNACVSISGIFANIAMKKFTLRQVSLIGSVLYTLSWTFSSFAQNIYQLVFTFSLMGFGTGVLFSVTYTCLNSYFVSNKRIMIVSFCQSMVCVGFISIPFLLKESLKEYGYRGTVLLYSGVLAHVIFASICMHPVEWHSPKKLLYKIVKECEDGDDTENGTNAKFTVQKVTEGKEGFTGQKSNGKLSFITDLLDITLLKDIGFINVLVGAVVGLLTDITFFTVYPQYLYDFKYDNSQVASFLTVLGATDLAGRLFLTVFTKFVNVKSEPLYYIAVVLTTFARVVFLFCENATSIYIITGVLGFLRATIQTLYALVFADYVPEKFPAALGWAMLLFGTASLPLMTITGILHEKTGSCTVGFVVLTALNLFCVIPWTYKIWYSKRRKTNG